MCSIIHTACVYNITCVDIWFMAVYQLRYVDVYNNDNTGHEIGESSASTLTDAQLLVKGATLQRLERSSKIRQSSRIPAKH